MNEDIPPAGFTNLRLLIAVILIFYVILAIVGVGFAYAWRFFTT